MKKIIIAVFIIVSVIGIAAGTTKKAPSKTSAAPKKEIVDPYVGWWYHEYDEALTASGEGIGLGLEDIDALIYISKENGKYYVAYYFDDGYSKEKINNACKNAFGEIKYEVNPKQFFQDFKDSNLKRATKTQVENLKWKIENAKWRSKKECDKIY